MHHTTFQSISASIRQIPQFENWKNAFFWNIKKKSAEILLLVVVPWFGVFGEWWVPNELFIAHLSNGSPHFFFPLNVRGISPKKSCKKFPLKIRGKNFIWMFDHIFFGAIPIISNEWISTFKIRGNVNRYKIGEILILQNNGIQKIGENILLSK